MRRPAWKIVTIMSSRWQRILISGGVAIGVAIVAVPAVIVNASETSEEMAVASGFLGKQLLLFPLCSPLVGENRSSWSPSGLEGGL